MITEKEYENLPERYKPFPIRLNASQIKHKALKCSSCGAIFPEKDKLNHLNKDENGIYCPIAKKALLGK